MFKPARIYYFVFSILLSLIINSQILAQSYILSNKNTVNYNDLTEWITKLCQNADNQTQQAYQIFEWIALNIHYDISEYNKEKISKPRHSIDILKSKKATSIEYAHLYQDLCERVGIKNQVIIGYEKNELYNEGMNFYKPNHAWNAVFADNKWLLCDPCNAAGEIHMKLTLIKKIKSNLFKKKLFTSTKIKFVPLYNQQYFNEYPLTFRISRLPVDPLWQLAIPNLPMSTFVLDKDSIIHYNNSSSVNTSNPDLFRINHLTNNQYNIESADRVYQFNPYYSYSKASKHIALSNEFITKLAETTSPPLAIHLCDTAKKEIEWAKNLLQEQKKNLNKEFAELRTINSSKKTSLLKYQKNFATSNIRFIDKALARNNAKIEKEKTIKSDIQDKKKKDNKLHYTPYQPTASPKYYKDFTVETDIIIDSLKARDTLLTTLYHDISNEKILLSHTKATINTLTESLPQLIYTYDSLLLAEAKSRTRIQDIAKDSIRMLRSEIYQLKMQTIDSLQTYYFNLYDSTCKSYERMLRKYKEQLQAAKSNLRSSLSLQKISQSPHHTDPNSYNNLYNEIIQHTINHDLSYLHFLKQQALFYYPLRKKYLAENKFFDYMKRNELQRNKHYRAVINKREKIERKWNENSLYEMDKLKKMTESYSDKLKKK